MMGPLEKTAVRAAAGDREALATVITSVKDDVFGLAMRMLGHPADAEDQTQEILIRIITSLGSFRGESSLRTWVWRIAANHLSTCRKGRNERFVSGFADIDRIIDEWRDVEPSAFPEAETQLLADEVKMGCLHGILLALERDERMAYSLGEVYGLSSEQAAEVLEIEPAAFRKRLSRAREALSQYMVKTCGLVSELAPCSCRRQIPVHLKHDFVRPERLLFLALRKRSAPDAGTAQPPANVIEAFAHSEKVAETFRSQGDYAAPETIVERIREVLAAGTFDFLA